MRFLDSAVIAGFLRPQHRAMAFVDHDALRLLRHFEEYEPPRVTKWMGSEES